MDEEFLTEIVSVEAPESWLNRKTFSKTKTKYLRKTIGMRESVRV